MSFYMTRNTDSNNIKPMFFGIAFIVMVMFCLIATQACQSFGTRQFLKPNSFIQSLTGGNSLGVPKFITERIPKVSNFAFFGLLIAFLAGFTLITLSVSLMGSFVFLCLAILLLTEAVAIFAPVPITIIRAIIFVKFRDGFNLIASRACFCSTWFSHLVLPFSKNYLVRAGQGLQSLLGSFHCRHICTHVKSKIPKNWSIQ